MVIPDIHGAYPEFTELLKATGMVDENLDWKGGETHLVSLGDLLDRGKDSRKVMDLLIRLQQQAPASGGKVHVVNGNHELMNLIADLRYVSKGEYAAFTGEETDSMRQQAFTVFKAGLTAKAEKSGESLDEESVRKQFEARFPPGYFGHRAAFSLQGRYGQWLLSLPLLIVINDIAFVHAGLPKIVSEMELPELNRQFQSGLTRYLQVWEELVKRGILSSIDDRRADSIVKTMIEQSVPSDCMEARQEQCRQLTAEGAEKLDPRTMNLLQEFVDLSEAPLLGVEGPAWYRGSVLCRPVLEEHVFAAALKRINASRVMVGHTVTKDRRVHDIRQHRLFMLDTGMLRSHYKNGRPAAMIIEDDQLTVQYLYPEERTVPIVENRVEAYKMSRHQLLEALAKGTVRDVQEGGPGASQRVTLEYQGNKIHALFYANDRDKSDQKELAAYHLDQLLGFELVPPTIMRQIKGRKGALQLWYKKTLTETQRISKEIKTRGWCPMPPQYQLMNTWDLLLWNEGRTFDNLLYRKKKWRVQLTEHAAAFSTRQKLPKKLPFHSLELTPGVVTALHSLDESRLNEALGSYLNNKQIRALLSRRDQILERFGNR